MCHCFVWQRGSDGFYKVIYVGCAEKRLYYGVWLIHTSMTLCSAWTRTPRGATDTDWRCHRMFALVAWTGSLGDDRGCVVIVTSPSNRVVFRPASLAISSEGSAGRQEYQRLFTLANLMTWAFYRETAESDSQTHPWAFAVAACADHLMLMLMLMLMLIDCSFPVRRNTPRTNSRGTERLMQINNWSKPRRQLK